MLSLYFLRLKFWYREVTGTADTDTRNITKTN
jgi:hypothetical protein